MAGRTAREAIDAFFEPHQRAVSCLTRAVLTGRVYNAVADPPAMTFTRGIERIGRFGEFSLAIRLWYAVDETEVGRWTVGTTGYEYRLHRAERDVVTYHWHPAGLSPVTYPHLHVGGRTLPTDLSKVHLVTGRVGLVDVVRMAIVELEVEPLRSDWAEVLDRAERDLAL